MTVGRVLAVYGTGADVVATRVPLQLLNVPVLQPPGIPVAWTVTTCGPAATGVKETNVLCPGASGSEVKIEPSTPIATWMSEQWLGEAVNWNWAMGGIAATGAAPTPRSMATPTTAGRPRLT